MGKLFATIDHDVIMDARDIGASAMLVYLIILKHANKEGGCWPSVTTICEIGGMGRSTALRAVKKLNQKGLITTKTVPGKVNQYRTTPRCTSVTTEPHQSQFDTPPSPSLTPVLVSPQDSKKNHRRRTTEEEPTKKKDLLARTFAEWWAAYPKKTKAGIAEGQWAQEIIHLGGDRDMTPDAAADFLLQRAKAFAGSEIAKELMFTPNPYDWLRERRYEDDEDVWNQKRGDGNGHQKPMLDLTKILKLKDPTE